MPEAGINRIIKSRGNGMNTENNCDGVENIEPKFDLALENFEIEDISDLNLHAPMSLTLCSSCSSCSGCCS